MNTKYLPSLLIAIIIVFPSFASEKINIAIMDLQGQSVSQPDAISLTNRIRAELYRSGHFTIVEREKVDEVLAELGLQQSGCTTSECIIELGQLLNVQRMIAGSVDRLGSLYTIHLRMIEVASGEVISLTSVDCEGTIEEVALKSTSEVVNKMLFELGLETAKPQYKERVRHPQRDINSIFIPDRAMTIKLKSVGIHGSFSYERDYEKYNDTLFTGGWSFIPDENQLSRYRFKMDILYGITDRLELSLLFNYLELHGDYYDEGQMDNTTISARYSLFPWSADEHGLAAGAGLRVNHRTYDGKTDFLFKLNYTSPWLDIIRFNTNLTYIINGSDPDNSDYKIGNEYISEVLVDFIITDKIMHISTFSYRIKWEDKSDYGNYEWTQRKRLEYNPGFLIKITNNFIVKPNFSFPLYEKGGTRSVARILLDFRYIF